jgi:hypothetical protein
LFGKKKEYFTQKIEITPKPLGIGIHNVNKSSVANGGCHLKKLSFLHFLISNFEKFQ